LFTLIGIAGEDDLDAPDLGAGRSPDPRAGLDVQTSTKPVADEPPFTPSGPGRKGKDNRPPRIVLAMDQSEALRDRLVAELSDLQSADEAADWVHKNLEQIAFGLNRNRHCERSEAIQGNVARPATPGSPRRFAPRDDDSNNSQPALAAKNTLITADADAVEAGFREKLATIERASAARQERLHSAPMEDPEPPVGKPFVATIEDAVAVAPPVTSDNASARRRRVAAKTIRLRDREHCTFVRTQPCVVCCRTPTEAHHIRFAQPRALGRKVSDEYTVPSLPATPPGSSQLRR
jgi:hypothetical protein